MIKIIYGNNEVWVRKFGITCPDYILQKHDSIYHSVQLIKKINQSKFKFKCKQCRTTFTVIIGKNYELCDKCNGMTYIPNFPILKPDFSFCTKCKDKGVIDWVESIFEV